MLQTKNIWVCSCGKLKKDWVEPSLKIMCPLCNTPLEEFKGTHQTKIISYISIDKEMKCTKRSIILKTIKECNHKGMFPNNREISIITNIPINVVTARVNELKKGDKPLIIEFGKKVDDKTNKITMSWKYV